MRTSSPAKAPPRYQATDERGVRAREDYEAFRGTLFATELIAPLSAWLHERSVDLRLQSHGGYADVLDAYGMADVPESEGLFGGGSYDFLRLAASAGHVGGQRYVSSETFPTIGTLDLSLDEVRILMGRAFSAGINRLMHHGNAYPYIQPDGQRWYPFHPVDDSAFATGPLDLSFDIHPDAEIWPSLPALNQVAARLSYALSRGSAVAEVAWLYPEWRAENFPNFGVEPGAYESDTSIALRRAGFGYDRISRSGLAGSTSTDAVLQVGQGSVPGPPRRRCSRRGPEDAAGDRARGRGRRAGGLAWRLPGARRRSGRRPEARDAMVSSLVESLRGTVVVVSSVEEIPAAIANAGVTPSLSPIDSAGLLMSVEHRRVSGGDVYFLFNESYDARTDQLRIEGAFDEALLLDPETGEPVATDLEGDVLTVSLPAARGAVLWVTRPRQD